MPTFSGLFHQTGGTYSLLDELSATEVQLAKLLNNRSRAKALNELLQTLNGQAVGATALAQETRVKNDNNDFSSVNNGGLRTMETVTHINRVTTAADQTELNTILTTTFAPTTYPKDKSGNGGGGNLSKIV